MKREDTHAPKDYYHTLQIDPDAEQEVVEVAYRRLARKYHPDNNPSRDAHQRMQEINEAYETLRDANRRAKYDERRRAKRADDAVQREKRRQQQESAQPNTGTERQESAAPKSAPSKPNSVQSTTRSRELPFLQRVLRGPLLTGVIVALVAIELSLYGMIRNPQATPLNLPSFLLVIILAGGSWGLIGFAIAKVVSEITRRR